MQLTAGMYLIVLPLVFLAAVVDSIGGGGGLISLPAYTLAGLDYGPMELAELVEDVTKEDVAAIARGVECDLIYFLKGNGEEGDDGGDDE